MSRYISKSVSLLTLTVVICGGLYALSLPVIGQAVFPFQANSSMLTGLDNKVVGSRSRLPKTNTFSLARPPNLTVHRHQLRRH